jgi:sortase A
MQPERPQRQVPFGVVRRAIGWLGQGMITLGVLILLFVAYQLWGTNLAEARSQDALKQDFKIIPGDVDPDKALPPSPDGEAVAVIKLPKIHVEKVVVEGVGVPDLKKGPGHYPGTPMPGQPGNAAIAGHRTTYGAPFNQLDKMAVGDPVIISTKQGTFEYETTELKVIKPSQVEVLDNTEDNRLTLTTCNPRYSATQRLVLTAALKGPAAAPSPDLKKVAVHHEEGLSGDPSARRPAILWGTAAALVWLAAYLIGRRWKKWPAYLIAAPFFFVLLFVFFENFARLLPANY